VRGPLHGWRARKAVHAASMLDEIVDSQLPLLAGLPESRERGEIERKQKKETIRKERNYTYHDVITVSPATLPNYEQKIKNFYEEHLHKDEEIRFFLEGSGFFDVRGHRDEWIRIAAAAGDMITLPPGIYHRYSNDEKTTPKLCVFSKVSPFGLRLTGTTPLTSALRDRNMWGCT